MADIEIRMLGKFEILMDGKPVLAALKQSRKATMLIQYLVLQKGERVTHKDLTDTLWNGERSTNPDMALRAIMHRFRNMIDAEGLKELETCIITSRGYYQWNPTMECRVDVFEMEALMEEARRQLNPAAAVARYERVLELYAGRLLPMSCNEPWVETRSLTLHVQYRIALFQVLEACKRKGENERIVKLCRRAIELDPYEERLYLEMIQALEALGRHVGQPVLQPGHVEELHGDDLPDQCFSLFHRDDLLSAVKGCPAFGRTGGETGSGPWSPRTPPA